MLHFLIMTALIISWRIILDKRSKLVQEQKKKKEHIKHLATKSDNNYDPEYFVWQFSNPEEFGE